MSSSDIAVKVSGLSKCYQIYDTPKDRLKQFFLPRLQSLFGLQPKLYFREFWALKDVSFEIKKGETVGIIGRNGSGKSTLLQMICGTLTPSGGTIQTNGKIAALLELGSGFNPEFTGRENVYMNASVLGLQRHEIDARFSAIAEFADIGEFIEQPVKTYSSGMMLRLAFAVIAHVDANVLVVDEALAVGDAVFTQKCMRFIRKFQEQGSLIFVSHDTASVQNLCRSAVWLKQGCVAESGNSRNVCESYLQFTLQEIYGEEAKLVSTAPAAQAEKPEQFFVAEHSASQLRNRELQESDYIDLERQASVSVKSNIVGAKGWRTGHADLVSVAFENVSAPSKKSLAGGETVQVRLRAKAMQALDAPILGFLVRDRLGQDLFGENTLDQTAMTPLNVQSGETFEAVFRFCLPMLPNGEYVVMASVANGDLHNNVQHHLLHDAMIMHVSSSKVRWGLVGISFEEIRMEIVK